MTAARFEVLCEVVDRKNRLSAKKWNAGGAMTWLIRRGFVRFDVDTPDTIYPTAYKPTDKGLAEVRRRRAASSAA